MIATPIPLKLPTVRLRMDTVTFTYVSRELQRLYMASSFSEPSQGSTGVEAIRVLRHSRPAYLRNVSKNTWPNQCVLLNTFTPTRTNTPHCPRTMNATQTMFRCGAMEDG